MLLGGSSDRLAGFSTWTMTETSPAGPSAATAALSTRYDGVSSELVTIVEGRAP